MTIEEFLDRYIARGERIKELEAGYRRIKHIIDSDAACKEHLIQNELDKAGVPGGKEKP